jgi:hypothetical protein
VPASTVKLCLPSANVLTVPTALSEVASLSVSTAPSNGAPPPEIVPLSVNASACDKQTAITRKKAYRVRISIFICIGDIVITKVPFIMSSSCSYGVVADEDKHIRAQGRVD